MTITKHWGGYRAEVMIDGVRLRQTCPSVDEAQRFLEDAARRSFRFGITPEKSRITFGELADKFIGQPLVEVEVSLVEGLHDVFLGEALLDFGVADNQDHRR